MPSDTRSSALWDGGSPILKTYDCLRHPVNRLWFPKKPETQGCESRQLRACHLGEAHRRWEGPPRHGNTIQNFY